MSFSFFAFFFLQLSDSSRLTEYACLEILQWSISLGTLIPMLSEYGTSLHSCANSPSYVGTTRYLRIILWQVLLPKVHKTVAIFPEYSCYKQQQLLSITITSHFRRWSLCCSRELSCNAPSPTTSVLILTLFWYIYLILKRFALRQEKERAECTGIS